MIWVLGPVGLSEKRLDFRRLLERRRWDLFTGVNMGYVMHIRILGLGASLVGRMPY